MTQPAQTETSVLNRPTTWVIVAVLALIAMSNRNSPFSVLDTDDHHTVKLQAFWDGPVGNQINTKGIEVRWQVGSENRPVTEPIHGGRFHQFKDHPGRIGWEMIVPYHPEAPTRPMVVQVTSPREIGFPFTTRILLDDEVVRTGDNNVRVYGQVVMASKPTFSRAIWPDRDWLGPEWLPSWLRKAV